MLHTDRSYRVCVNTAHIAWESSPEPGVERKLLELDDDSFWATLLERFAPGARFSGHTHPRGEEFLVLAGSITDEHGHYPAGTYVRNPPGTYHEAYSDTGCTLLLKLRQMHAEDHERVVVDTTVGDWESCEEQGPERQDLFRHPENHERVSLVRFAPGARLSDDLHPGGEELYVIDGVLADEFGTYPAGTWLRQPHGSRHAPYSEAGCTLWVKRGHLQPA